MPIRVLAFVFVGVLTVSAQAQLSSDRVSPINSFGRYHGFGYSDGYHSCKNGCTKSWSISNLFGPMSSFYGSPTPPPNHGAIRMSAPVYSQNHYSQNFEVQSFDASSSSITVGQPQLSQPMPTTGAASGMPQWNPSSSNSGETYPAPSLPNPPSPSDRSNLELLPAPNQKPELISPAPSVQSRRVPPGAQSLIQQSTFRLR